MTTTRDDAVPSSSAPHVGEASAFPGVQGMRWWAVLLLALVLTAAGVAIDVVRTGALGAVFLGAYPGGCVLATLLAQRRDLFVPMVQPPLLLALSVPVAVGATGSLPASGGLVSSALAIGAPLINGFPAMAITTIACVVIGLVRMRVQRWQRSGDEAEARREPVRAGPVAGARGKQGGSATRDRAPSNRDDRDRRESEQAERERRRAQERARAERDREQTEQERVERERRERELAERDRARREPARGDGATGRPAAPRGAPGPPKPDRDEPRPAAQRSSPPPDRDEPRGAPAQRSPGRAVPKSERPAPERPAPASAPAPAPGRGGGPGPREPRAREDRMREERLREEQERRGGPGQPPPGVHPVRERRPDDRRR